MADPDLVPAVKALTRRLRAVFCKSGHPPHAAQYEADVPEVEYKASKSSHGDHPLGKADSRFRWFLGDPSKDESLRWGLKRLPVLRKMATAVSRVNRLAIACGPRTGHFQIVWDEFLSARWFSGVTTSHGWGMGDDGKTEKNSYGLGFTAVPISRNLLSDLLESAKQAAAHTADADTSEDREKNPKKMPRRGPRDRTEFAKFKAAIVKGQIAGRSKKDIALEFAKEDMSKAEALLRRLRRHPDG